jgi:uncharacterized protein YcbK (DUF882 family)
VPLGGVHLKTCRVAATRVLYPCGLALLLTFFASRALQNAVAEGDTRTISLHHIHTNEDITITFKRDGRYDEAALEKLNWFLRDWRRNQETRMDPHLIDLVWEVQRETGSKEPIWVVCGYRSPQTNAMLRRRSKGVARFSQHMLGHAMDFYIPGVPLTELRVIGLRLQRGGVGFYPTSGSPFVHMDTGGVRMWPRMTRDQLMHVFPDGRTVHIPSDGRPLAGYALALADIRARGGTPSNLLLEQARSAGVNVADNGLPAQPPPRLASIAKIFGLGSDDEDEDAAPAAVASNTPDPPAPPLRTRAKAAVASAISHVEAKIARAEDKVAAEKTKLIKAASKAHVISRAEAAPAAPLTPNQVIVARGFWQGLPTAVASADTTGSVSPFVSSRETTADETLAYAEQPARAIRAALITSAPLPAVAGLGGGEPDIIAAQAGDSATTIAVKRVNGRPSSAILTVTNKRLANPLADSKRIGDPWLLALLVSPSVTRFLDASTLGARDFRSLAALMIKPDHSIVMVFSADPNPGLTSDRFSGSAVVFVSTVSYPLRTAQLQ